MKEEKKIIFSEKIDSSINGFAIVVAFIGIGLFLAYHNDYFGNTIVSKIVQWIFIIIGGLGLCVEISNLRKNNPKKNIEGISDFVMGITFLVIWWIIYNNLNIWYINIINLFFLMFGLYGSWRGILEIGYSFFKTNKQDKKSSILSFIKELILIISEILAIVVAIINILQATNLIQFFSK